MSDSSFFTCASPSVSMVTTSTTSFRRTTYCLLGRFHWRLQFYGTGGYIIGTSPLATSLNHSPWNPGMRSVISFHYLHCGRPTGGSEFTPERFRPPGVCSCSSRKSITSDVTSFQRGGHEGKHPGLMPLLKVYDSLAGYWSRSNRHRSSSATVYLPIWHSDVRKFVVTRTNKAASGYRFSHLFPALWIPHLL